MDEDNDAIVVLLILKTAISILGLIGNVLVCITIGYTKTLHNVTNLMILNLAIADALVSLCGTQEGWLINNPQDSYFMSNKTECTSNDLFRHDSMWIHIYFTNSFSAHSVLCLAAATFEQFIGISRPLHYTSYFSTKKLVVLLVSIWVMPIFTYLPSVIHNIITFHSNNCQTDGPFLMLTITKWLLFGVPTGCIIGMYIKILNNLKRGAQNLQEQGVQGPRRELLHARRQVARAMALVVLAFIILVIPEKIWFLLDKFLVNLSIIGRKTLKLLVQINSSINPVLYGFKYKKLRNAFGAMVSKCINMRHPNKVGQALDLQTIETA